MEEYTLYRTYSKDGTLLYIGQSNSWPRRFMEHRTKSPWFQDAVKVEIQSYLTKRDLDEAERQAVEKEKPAHNVIFNNGNQSSEVIVRSKRRNSVSDNTWWQHHEPFGPDNCYKCGQQHAPIDEAWLSVEEMVTEIEKHGNIKDGVARYCWECFCGYKATYLTPDKAHWETLSSVDRTRRAYAIDAANARRYMEFQANGVDRLQEVMDLAEDIVENRRNARTEKCIETRRNNLYSTFKAGQKYHYDPTQLWPARSVNHRPVEISGMIFGMTYNLSGHADYLDDKGNTYKWERSFIFARTSDGCGWVQKPIGEAKTYEGFVGTVLRIEGHK